MTENPNNEEFKAKFQDVLSSDDKINAFLERLVIGMKSIQDEPTYPNLAKMLVEVVKQD